MSKTSKCLEIYREAADDKKVKEFDLAISVEKSKNAWDQAECATKSEITVKKEKLNALLLEKPHNPKVIIETENNIKELELGLQAIQAKIKELF